MFEIDGLESEEPDAPYINDGQFPPFVIFDVEMQRNLSVNFQTREEAKAYADAHGIVITGDEDDS